MEIEPSSALSAAQQRALRSVEDRALQIRSERQDRIDEILSCAGLPVELYYQAVERLQREARIAIHFHPDRYSRDGRTVAEGLLAQGRYLSQFVTGLSSGSRTAQGGGPRDLWEARLFGEAYQQSGVLPEERPLYGSLALLPHPDGPSPRFGSCYLLLRPEVSRRATFTWAGSELTEALDRAGTLAAPEPVLAALLAEIAAGAQRAVPWPPWQVPTLGVPGLSLSELLAGLREGEIVPSFASARPPGRVLDSYIEAQVHGPVELGRDVEVLVIDPSFLGTEVGEQLAEIVRRYPLALEVHGGFELCAREVPTDFRGSEVARLAGRWAPEDRLNAAAIGAAEAAIGSPADLLRGAGEPAELSQLLKKLWHVVVHHGRAR